MSETVDFANPPVTETMLGAWFAPLQWDQSLLGLYREFIREQYPHFEDAAPIQGGPSAPFALFSSTRGLYYNENRVQLVQLQQTMFYVNWRRLDGDEAYPRYHDQQKRFLEEWTRFKAFLAREGRPSPIVTTCQVCYVNHVEILDGESHGAVVGRILAAGKSPSLAHVFTDATDLNFTGSYSAAGGSNLAIQLFSVLRAADNRKMLQLSLTSNHSSTDADSTEALMASFDAAHDDLIRAFLRITSDDARKGWGQK